jgi:hypothetical protein
MGGWGWFRVGRVKKQVPFGDDNQKSKDKSKSNGKSISSGKAKAKTKATHPSR